MTVLKEIAPVRRRDNIVPDRVSRRELFASNGSLLQQKGPMALFAMAYHEM